jgi:hypothetical protein
MDAIEGKNDVFRYDERRWKSSAEFLADPEAQREIEKRFGSDRPPLMLIPNLPADEWQREVLESQERLIELDRRALG